MKTARRLDWRFLPPGVRRYVEHQCGSPVVEARSQDSGFTPGFASVLLCADGSRHFVKAANQVAQPGIWQSYRDEIRVLRALPGSVPAPELRWTLEQDWVVLATRFIEGRAPGRPWTSADLTGCLSALEAVAANLTPPPLPLTPFAEEFADVHGWFETVRSNRTELAGRVGDEVAALLGEIAEHSFGESLVHTDLRDDNILIERDDRVWFVDWNWPVTGAAWIDSLILLIGPRAEGLDVEAELRTRPLLRDVDADALDSMLAFLLTHFWHSAALPVPATSPHLRAHAAWQGEVVWEWLAERRGWTH